MNKIEIKIDITKYGRICEEAADWYEDQPSFKEAWTNCHRGDWMLYIAALVSVDKRLLIKTAGRCAATVEHLMKDQRSLDGLKGCEYYGDGKIDEAELKKITRSAAYAVAYASSVSSAVYAAHAAAYASNATYASNAADYAAKAAGYAAKAAKETNQQLTAKICREMLTLKIFTKLGIHNEEN